ncbi:MAG: hypothetical protein JO261_07010 [Alphaproteobacteria bacterium]|nr:hypothetical protein [Alphaproteobacteria bacterium]MBV9693431.1 hypothetical protein [Alphaproteobacteria bacterium]
MIRAMITTGSSFTLAPPTHALAQAVQPAAPKKHSFSFGDFLDIVNPLQHLPVVGTLYRALTGDKIDTPEKLVGDTLYGGPLGALSALADIGYQQLSGKSFGDTVLDWFSSDRSAPPAPATEAKVPTPAASADVAARSKALARNGSDEITAQRALFAYRRSLSASPSFFSES